MLRLLHRSRLAAWRLLRHPLVQDNVASWWEHHGFVSFYEREDPYQHEVDTGAPRRDEVDLRSLPFVIKTAVTARARQAW